MAAHYIKKKVVLKCWFQAAMHRFSFHIELDLNFVTWTALNTWRYRRYLITLTKSWIWVAQIICLFEFLRLKVINNHKIGTNLPPTAAHTHTHTLRQLTSASAFLLFFFFNPQTHFLCSFCWILSASDFCCGLRGAVVSWLEACLMGIRTRAARRAAIFANHRKHTNSSVFIRWLVAGGAGSSLLSLVSFGSCIFLCSYLQRKSTDDYWKGCYDRRYYSCLLFHWSVGLRLRQSALGILITVIKSCYCMLIFMLLWKITVD